MERSIEREQEERLAIRNKTDKEQSSEHKNRTSIEFSH
jgi:hypothetical protein